MSMQIKPQHESALGLDFELGHRYDASADFRFEQLIHL